MDIFNFRRKLIDDYAGYTRSFLAVREPRLREFVEEQLDAGVLWPEPLIQLNPAFEPGDGIDDLAAAGVLHPECRHVFRIKSDSDPQGRPLKLHATSRKSDRRTGSYVLTTGTGSGKSLAYIVPIVDHIPETRVRQGIRAIVVYPMNALASQLGELDKFLGLVPDRGPVISPVHRSEKPEERERILSRPPDILLTNYVMLELILTRPRDRQVERPRGFSSSYSMNCIHTGATGADVAMLIRRVRTPCPPPAPVRRHVRHPQHRGDFAAQQRRVADVAGQLFGTESAGRTRHRETLRRVTPALDLTSLEFQAALATRVGTRAVTPRRTMRGSSPIPSLDGSNRPSG